MKENQLKTLMNYGIQQIRILKGLYKGTGVKVQRENMIPYLFLFSFTAIIILVSCSASVRQAVSNPNLRLSNYNRIVFNLVNASESTSYSTATIGQVSGGHLMSGSDQAIQALESLQFELMSMGFSFVENENDADVIVEFSIGNIRYDPLAGWIADQAFVKFKDAKSGKMLALYRATSQVVTPTANNIISNLSKSIKKNY